MRIRLRSARWRFDSYGPADQIYQLKIVLKYRKPPVWRRVLVTGETMIGTLHEIVQIVMGWQNRHLYTFTVRGRDYGIAHEGGLSLEAAAN